VYPGSMKTKEPKGDTPKVRASEALVI